MARGLPRYDTEIMKRRSTRSKRAAAPRWSNLASRVAKTGDRVVVKRAGERAVAIVPADDLRLIEAIEDQMDVDAAKEILRTAKPSDFLPIEKLRIRRGRS